VSKKDKNHKMSFRCPSCGQRNETRNMYPKCFHCGASLKIIEVNPEVKAEIREKKKKQ